jgi:hypothetical protein
LELARLLAQEEHETPLPEAFTADDPTWKVCISVGVEAGTG